MQDLFKPSVDKVKIDIETDLTEFHYEDGQLFTQPIVVRGTRKQFIPAPLLRKMQDLNESNTPEILANLQTIEDFDFLYLASISEMNLIAIQEKGFLFQVVQDKTFNLFIPFDGGDYKTVSFKRLSKLLDIPYAFSKKNPYNINQVNFEFWKNKISETLKKPLAICVVFKKSSEIPLLHEMKEISANLVMTLLNVSSAKQADGSHSCIKKDLQSQVPLLHKAIPAFTDLVKSKLPEAKVILHSCEFGFENQKGSKNDHFAKFLIDHPSMKFKITRDNKEEEYMPTISLRTNFDGSSKTYGYYETSISLMRLVCQNGMMVSLPDEYMQNLQEGFVNSLLAVNDIDPDSKSYEKMKTKYKVKFQKICKGTVSSVNFHEFLNALDKSNFAGILDAFIATGKSGKLLESFKDLEVPIVSVLDEDFVEAVENLSRIHKLPPAITKGIILEYLSSKEDGVISFKDAYSIVQYVSFIGQAFNVRVQQNLERNVVKFGIALTAALVKKNNDKMERLSKYRSMLK